MKENFRNGTEGRRRGEEKEEEEKEERVDEEIRRLYQLIPDAKETFSLMNSLILNPSTRFQCLKSGISFISHSLFQGKEALTLMSLLHYSILLYQNPLSSSSSIPSSLSSSISLLNNNNDNINDNPTNRSNNHSNQIRTEKETEEREGEQWEESNEEKEERIESSLVQLYEIAKHIADSILCIPSSMDKEAEEGGLLLNRRREIGGIITSLDLLGTLITVSKSLEEQCFGRKSFTSKDILMCFLRTQGNRRMKMDFIPAFLSCVSELNLDPDELRMIRELVERYLKDGGKEVSLVVKQLFPLFRDEKERRERIKWIQLLFLLLSNTTKNDMGTVQFVVEMGMQHSRSVIIWIMDYIQDEFTAMTIIQQFDPTWLLMIILIASTQESKTQSFKTIVELFNKLFEVSKGNERKLTQQSLNHYFYSLIRTPGMEIRSQVLTELGSFLFLLEDESLIQIKGTYPRKIKSIGNHILSQIFFVYPVARSDILGNIFGEISEGLSLVIKLQYCSLLHQICEKGILLLSDFIPKIQDWLGFIMYFPLPVGVEVIHSLLPLIQISPSFLDFLFILFRKLLSARGSNARILSIRSLFLLLCSPHLQSDSNNHKSSSYQREILSILESAFNFPLEIRGNFYFSLHHYLLKCESSKTLDDENLEYLLEMVMGRFERYISLDSAPNIRPDDSHHLNMISSSSPFSELFCIRRAFEVSEFAGDEGESERNENQIRKREDFARLFSLSIKVMTQIMNLPDTTRNRFDKLRRLQSVILAVTIQFGHPVAFESMCQIPSEHAPTYKGKEKQDMISFLKAQLESHGSQRSRPPFPECPSERISMPLRVELMMPVYLMLTENFSQNSLFKDLFKTCSSGGAFKACLYFFNRFSALHLSFPKVIWMDCFVTVETVLNILECFIDTLHLSYNEEKDLEPSNTSVPPFVSIQMAISCVYLIGKMLNDSKKDTFNSSQFSEDQTFQLCKCLLNLLYLCLKDKEKLKSRTMKCGSKTVKPISKDFIPMFHSEILNSLFLLFSRWIITPAIDSEKAFVLEINFEGVETFVGIFKRVVDFIKENGESTWDNLLVGVGLETQFDCPKIATFFSKVLQKEVEESISVEATQGYVKIIDLLSRAIAPKRWKKTIQVVDGLNEVIQSFKDILSEYRIANPDIVTTILKYILDYAPRKDVVAIALEALESCVEDAPKKNCLQVCENESCQNASVKLILTLFSPMISDLFISFKEFERFINCLIKLNSFQLNYLTKGRLFLTILKLLNWSLGLLQQASQGIEKKKILQKLSPLLSEERYINVLARLKYLFNLILFQINLSKENFSKIMKIPLIIARIERYEVKLQNLLILNKNHKEYPLLKVVFNKVDEEFHINKDKKKNKKPNSNIFESDDEKKPKSQKGVKRRSKNAYIDANIEELDSDDNLDELEDFIICKKGRIY
eukprot:TRINITY_DN7669_c0_g1_i1.p1 TRINITY_DN7669_c0_g1~~TRINITY_DN7669_c0_g1_i1.p1  ORF type:complete len:1427 (+),score=300.22 TRINITY_DN7669_c0_g1_i1:125-4405(+)